MGKDRSSRRPARAVKAKSVARSPRAPVAQPPAAVPAAWDRALELLRTAVGKLLDAADRTAETITRRRRPS